MLMKLFCAFLCMSVMSQLVCAQNLIVDIPAETTESNSDWKVSNPDLPFQLYWKSKSGQYINLNEASSLKQKINQYQLYYSFLDKPKLSTDFVEMPLYISTKNPVKLKPLQNGIWQLWFIGLNRRVYSTTLKLYNPISWMKDMLKPLQSKKSLKDIVIPGSHDAGMSVLTATGGQQKGTINACNTLTQQLVIEQQLMQGIRMFDLRVGTYNESLYTKHAAADCMADAIGGGYGEPLKTVSLAIKQFLKNNSEEIVLVSFSHFCETETPLKQLQDSLLNWIGKDKIYQNNAVNIGDVPISQLAGKAILSFEIPNWKNPLFPNCSIADSTDAFVNFRRAYASTNDLKKLLQTEESFFNKLQLGVQKNDLIRLDWQITQSADEASAVCNDFQDERLNPLVNGAILLANMIRKNKSIIDHAKIANQQLPLKMNEWIENKIITNKNKPNIIYVDVAGAWVTDYCASLYQTPLYQ